ncbi:MAG: membrane dipeptidase [Burkholderiaceae bacterium]|nr:membrane dipeptidase [Burkholderiaceae bacterium]
MIRWEAHTCLPTHPQADFAPLDALHAAGVNHLSLNVGADMNPLPQIMAVLAAFRARIAAAPERYVLAASVGDVRRAAAEGKLSIAFDLEGALPLQEQPEMVGLFAALGVRQIHFAYNRNNNVADGCHDSERGLTPLGRRMVEAVNRAGVLMDCSHTGRNCSLDIMAASSQPVIFSHANPLALARHGRNITDEQIRACAATGGVVCISGLSFFVGKEYPNADDVARHVACVAEIAGAEHVGIGLDICFDQDGLDYSAWGEIDRNYWWPARDYDLSGPPPTFTPPQTWQQLPEALQRVGLSPKEIEGVLGGNMLRVAERVWAPS